MRRFNVKLSDGIMTGIALGDPARPIDAAFIHATGFNAATYQSMLDPLKGEFHCIALDMRGHGRSRMLYDPRRMKSWNRFRDDVIEALERIAPQGVVLSGHSMGATVALLVAARRPDLVRGLVLVDPVLLQPSLYLMHHVLGVFGVVPRSDIARRALRRRRSFSSPAEAFAALSGRSAFQSWRPPFLEDYLLDGLLRQDNGAFALACEPEWESAVFSAQRIAPWGAISRLRKQSTPVIILQAERGSTSPLDLDERIHAVRPDVAVVVIPGSSHFIPMERPYAVRDAIRLILENERDGGRHSDDYVGAVRRALSDDIGG
jgi:pimeloyl-ACP methyl ester carboxylesterase